MRPPASRKDWPKTYIAARTVATPRRGTTPSTGFIAVAVALSSWAVAEVLVASAAVAEEAPGVVEAPEAEVLSAASKPYTDKAKNLEESRLNYGKLDIIK